MAVNPDQLWTTLDKIEQKLLSIVDDFDAVSQAAVALNGDVAKVLPVQLNASADAVLELVNGAGQNSIKNLKEYVDNIPLGELRQKSSAESIRNGQRNAPTAGAAPTASTAASVDLTPRTDAPQSAIAQEGIDLSKYKKNKIEESTQKKLNEDNEFSFDAIMDEAGIDEEGYDSEIPEADTDYLEDDLADGFNDDFEEEDTFDFDAFEAERLADGEEPTYEDAFSYNDEIFDDAL